jgi:hypothetical protein
MDRAPDYGSGGWGFKSLRAHHFARSYERELSGDLARVLLGCRIPSHFHWVEPIHKTSVSRLKVNVCLRSELFRKFQVIRMEEVVLVGGCGPFVIKSHLGDLQARSPTL